MKVSVNLVTWNGKKYLPYCLESIANQTFRDFSLFILDNGSTDGTAEYLKNCRLPIADCRIIYGEENIGFAAGHNQALKLTESEYILMLNQDITLEPNFLEVVIKFMDAHPEVGAVTGKLLYWDFENNKKTSIIDSAGLKIFKNHRVVELGAGEPDSKKWSKQHEVFGVSAAAPVYRRRALEDAAISIPRQSVPNSASVRDKECFDEDFFSYKEDIDLAYRLRLRGWQAWFLPEARVYHDRTAQGAASGNYKAAQARKNKTKFVNYHSYKNHLFFLTKNLTWPIFLRNFPHIFWYEFKKFIYILFFETATLKSLCEFFGKLPSMWGKRKYIMARKTVKTEDIVKWLNG